MIIFFFKKYGYLIATVIGLLILICFLLLLIPESQMPTILQSSGLVAIISAFLGVVMTVAVTAILLEKQAETQKELLDKQSETESKKDKDMKIHERKIHVFSAFTSKMWKMADEASIIELKNKYEELRSMCFGELVFFLTQKEIEELTAVIGEIDNTKPIDFNLKHFCKITNILQSSLENKHESEVYLQKLYNAFDRNSIGQQNDSKHTEIANKASNTNSSSVTFWHFNVWGEEQITAFKNSKWFLSLIEYGEDWRTGLLKQVKPNDIVFLFKRGGTGYIGAFKVLDPPWKIIQAKENYDDYNQEEKEEIAEYDIYEAIEDGATLVSCILVEPIAYNYKGVGYLTVRRRTIERMNDPEAVKYLIEKFSNNSLNPEQKKGIGKLDEITSIPNLNTDYFNRTLTKQN
ncbi:MAG: hypothetical protein LBF85_09825 [Tannerella sp.]|jgi:hypothetical protein|nr:hypothetical protein [Tannerella sp.]